MRKWLLSLFLCLALALSAKMSWATTEIALDNQAGGAAITYWTCKNGFETLVNVQNVQAVAVAAHVVIFDQDSREIMDFTVPLSPYDNWGASITCEDGLIRVNPVASFYQGPNNGSEPRHAPTSAVEGYITVAVTAVDGCVIANGDPRDEVANPACNYNAQGGMPNNGRLPNALILRSAMVNYQEGNAFALNSVALVNFVNQANNFRCLNDDNAGNPTVQNRPADDVNGVNIGICEILDSTNNNFTIGSANGQYWARYGENEIVDTSFVMIFPAMGGNNKATLNIYDDNELHQSAYINASEVENLSLMGPFDTEGQVAAFASGEIRLAFAPKYDRANNLTNDNDRANELPPALFGFSLVEGPNFVDIYPIVRECFVGCRGNNCAYFGINCPGNRPAAPAPAAGGNEGGCPGGICP